MKIGILGAGISGLSIAKSLYKYHDVEILEKKTVFGGIARTKDVDGVSYHVTGGHCFNSKHQDVMDFVFNEILPKCEWHKVNRDAVIRFKNHEISYPIEFAIKEIHEFDKDLALNITRDFLNAKDDKNYDNLENWFRKKFGNTLSDEYFIPYNKKIWNKNPSEMDPSWVEGKLPIPNKESFFNGLLGVSKDKMPHSEFYYPISNNQNTFIDALASKLKINFNYKVQSIKKDAKSNVWVINNDLKYDLVINTLPLNILPKLIENCPDNIVEASNLLKYNKVSSMLWETLPTNRTWTYIPDSDNFFHRYIHIGNFFMPKKNFTITEVIGEKSKEEMIENGKKDSFLIKPLDYNISDHAYVVFDENYEKSLNTIKGYLGSSGLHTLGRFGEWEYYNMDICIKSALELSKKILGQ